MEEPSNGATLTCELSIDHDVQVLLGEIADVSGDGVEPDGGILQGETHPRAIEPGQTPKEQTNSVGVDGFGEGAPERSTKTLKWTNAITANSRSLKTKKPMVQAGDLSLLGSQMSL